MSEQICDEVDALLAMKGNMGNATEKKKASKNDRAACAGLPTPNMMIGGREGEVRTAGSSSLPPPISKGVIAKSDCRPFTPPCWICPPVSVFRAVEVSGPGGLAKVGRCSVGRRAMQKCCSP